MGRCELFGNFGLEVIRSLKKRMSLEEGVDGLARLAPDFSAKGV